MTQAALHSSKLQHIYRFLAQSDTIEVSSRALASVSLSHEKVQKLCNHRRVLLNCSFINACCLTYSLFWPVMYKVPKNILYWTTQQINHLFDSSQRNH